MTISGALPTVYVGDMDTAVRFYTEALGLKLLARYGNHWASIHCGNGQTIGLHPETTQNPAGRAGSVTIGFQVAEPIRDVIAALKARGVVFRGGVVDDTQVLLAHFQDPDGNAFYLAEPQADHQRRTDLAGTATVPRK